MTQSCLFTMASNEFLPAVIKPGFDIIMNNETETALNQKEERDFYNNMRLTKACFNELLSLIVPHYVEERHGHKTVDVKTALYITLWYLGNKTTFREVAELFGYSKSVVHKCFYNVVNIISNLAPQYIKWPKMEDMHNEERKFREVAGFPGVIGLIDGCQFEIEVPDAVQKDYLNRNHRHSVNLLAVCNKEKMFTYVYAGFPGSAHDCRVFQHSDLGNQMNDNPEMLFLDNTFHILGDSAFPVGPHMLTPFKETQTKLTPRQRQYNFKHSQTRVGIENSFGLLKKKFRCLLKLEVSLENIPTIIKVCCVLHNISIVYPNDMYYLNNEIGSNENVENQNNVENEVVDQDNFEGKAKRNRVMNNL